MVRLWVRVPPPASGRAGLTEDPAAATVLDVFIRGLIYALVVWLGAKLWRSLSVQWHGFQREARAPQPGGPPPPPHQAPSQVPERLLSCDVCGVRFPASQGRHIVDLGRDSWVCSSDCLAKL